MGGQLTVLSAGAATVPASGNYTALGLAQVQAIFDQQATIAGGSTIITFDPANPVIPTVPAGQFGQYILIVPNAVTQALTLALPSGYGAVILGRGTNATVTGGDPTTRIVSGGVLDYTGLAMLVDASGGSGLIDDTQANAIIEVGGGAYSVTAGGAGSIIRVDNGGPDRIVAGAGEFIQLGNGSPGGTYYELYPYAASVSAATVKTGLADVVTVNGTGFLIVDNAPGAGATTINALYGSSTVFGGTFDVYDGRLGTATTEFIATGATQTVFGGGGNDTVFGGPGVVVYDQGTGARSFFVGGSGLATVNADGAGAIFAGTGETLVNLNAGNDVFVGGPGSATIVGGSSIPTVFGGSNESVQIVGSHVAFVVAGGGNSTLSGAGAVGTVNFFVQGAQGNLTLVGSASAFPDTFQIHSAPAGHAQTIDIQNWHNGDGLFMSGFTVAQISAFDSIVNSGGGALITLSDGTTIRFDGAHPNAAIGGVGF